MAITRAQQVRQMLIKGGVANPDGRRGFFQGALDDANKKNEPMSPGTSVGGNTRGGTGKGRDLDVQQRGSTEAQYNRMVAEGTQGSYKGSDDPPLPPQLKEDESFIPTPVPKGIGFIDRNKNKLIQASIDRNKYLALKKLGLIKDPGFTGFIGTTIDALTGEIPEQFELMSEEDLLDIATSGPYLSQQKTEGDVNKFSSGKDLLGRTFEAEDLLRKGDMTQTKYDELFPGPTLPPDDRGSDQQETDPCKGPNPPAYCFVNQDDPDDTGDDDDTNTGGLAIRFRKDGGRINAMDGGMMSPVGGIMDLESGRQMYFLGKLVKKATRAVKKVAKSPLGKAALLAGLNFAPTLFNKGTVLQGLGGMFSKKGLSDFFFAGKDMALKNLTGKGALAGIGALSALPLIFQGDEEEEDQTVDRGPGLDIDFIRNNPYNFLGRRFVADGGIMRTGYQEGSKEPVAKKTLPLLDMDGMEKDYREDGGFVPIGRMERADDVPARLSKNEFVFTADAVRNAGDGDVDKGAEVMYNMMKNLESGGEVSEESQGLQGAREMFQTSKRLEEVL